jgi:hypothetical protein
MNLIRRPLLCATLCLTIANPAPGFAAGFRASFPPSAPELVELVGQKTPKKRPAKPKHLPFREEPAPGDVNLGPVKARPGKNDKLVRRVPTSRRATARDEAAAQVFMGLMLGAAVGALAGSSGVPHGGGGPRSVPRRSGGVPSSAHHCSVDYTTPNPTSLYCR